MTSTITIDATSTMTDRAVIAMADRALHAARTAERPLLDASDLAVTWLGDRGFFTNTAHVLCEPADWEQVLERVDAAVPAEAPVSLISPWSVPTLDPARWQLVGHPPLMVRAPDTSRPASSTSTWSRRCPTCAVAGTARRSESVVVTGASRTAIARCQNVHRLTAT